MKILERIDELNSNTRGRESIAASNDELEKYIIDREIEDKIEVASCHIDKDEINK